MKRLLTGFAIIAFAVLGPVAHVAVNPLRAEISGPNDARECVVLLHGLARTQRSMRGMAGYLANRGLLAVNVAYPSTQLPVRELGEAAVGYGLAQCRQRDAERIHFVTHSLGGILVRSYLAEHTVRELGNVVMLAPPNGGSEAADRFRNNPVFGLVGGPAALEIGTDAASMPLALPAADFSLGVIAGSRSINPWLSYRIPGDDDGKVAVARTQVDGMKDFLVVPATHVFIMQQSAVQRAVAAFLRHGHFQR